MTTEQDPIETLANIRAEIASLRIAERELVEAIHNDTTIPRRFDHPLGRVELAKSYNRRWDHDQLVTHLTRMVLDTTPTDPDPETGEIPYPWERVRDAIMDCAGIGYWRVGKLKDRGLDPDEFAERTSTSLSVRITGPKDDD